MESDWRNFVPSKRPLLASSGPIAFLYKQSGIRSESPELLLVFAESPRLGGCVASTIMGVKNV